ncbi:hypothetical protein [Pseudozobellia sp. WGM2]|uniref:hypothetical protein n=1 Tax=Pseudozobellia sp. WGM2 TaxID=2787625 RepID=UPI001ADEDC86|nr:hypothetical protein [Pseudozobellia sp. WGM2]
MSDFDLLPCGVIRLNLKETIVEVNPYILDKLGYEFAELEDSSINSLLSSGSRILYKTHFYPILVGKKIIHEIVLSLVGKKGNKHPFLFNMSMSSSDILITGLFLNKRSDFESGLIEAKNAAEIALLKNQELMLAHKELGDFQKQLEIQLREEKDTNKDLRVLNKMISHDLQEPLRKIQLFASKIISRSNNEYRQEIIDNLSRIVGIAHEGHLLTKRLQLYSELEYYPLRKAHFDLRTTIESTRAKSVISKYDFKFDLQVNSVYGDETQITLLFTELFTLIGRLMGPNNANTLNIQSRMLVMNEKVLSTSHRKQLRLSFFTGYPVKNGHAVIKSDGGGEGRRLLDIGMDAAFCEKIIVLHGGLFNLEIMDNKEIGIEIVLPYESL